MVLKNTRKRGHVTKAKPITNPVILIVEGKDEENLLTAYLNNVDLRIDIRPIGGKDQFNKYFPALLTTPGLELIESIG
ncbi:MAG: hypothetical protein AB1896_10445, partial [Thermodesulfobacteriota bacterium]